MVPISAFDGLTQSARCPSPRVRPTTTSFARVHRAGAATGVNDDFLDFGHLTGREVAKVHKLGQARGLRTKVAAAKLEMLATINRDGPEEHAWSESNFWRGLDSGLGDWPEVRADDDHKDDDEETSKCESLPTRK